MKDISGFKFEMIKDYDKLRVESRKMERKHKLPEKETKKTTNLMKIIEKNSFKLPLVYVSVSSKI